MTSPNPTPPRPRRTPIERARDALREALAVELDARTPDDPLDDQQLDRIIDATFTAGRPRSATRRPFQAEPMPTGVRPCPACAMTHRPAEAFPDDSPTCDLHPTEPPPAEPPLEEPVPVPAPPADTPTLPVAPDPVPPPADDPIASPVAPIRPATR